MNHLKTISLECPYCDTKCQFLQIDTSHKFCSRNDRHHIAFACSNCNGGIITHWNASTNNPTDSKIL